MHRKIALSLATLATLVVGTAIAGDIYRYTDAQGNVHYVDRPTGAETEERVAIASRRTDAAAVQARYNSRFGDKPATDGAPAADQGAAEEEPEAKKTRAEKLAAQRERQQKCQSYRDRMETLMTARRLYREDESGERRYLEENEIQDARDKTQQLIEENCS